MSEPGGPRIYIADLAAYNKGHLDVPETLRAYITVDTEALGRDGASDMQSSWSEGRLYVFFD